MKNTLGVLAVLMILGLIGYYIHTEGIFTLTDLDTLLKNLIQDFKALWETTETTTP